MYSFSMILYQLFEQNPPFAGVDPVEAARQAALYDKRPNLGQLGESKPFPLGVSLFLHQSIPHLGKAEGKLPSGFFAEAPR